MNRHRRKCAGHTAHSGTPCRRQTTPTQLYCSIHKRKYWRAVRKEQNEANRIHYENWGN